MNDSKSFSAVAALAFACAVLLAASPLHAQCTIDAQGADDEPGQKDMSQVCLAGTCSGSNLPVTWSLDDTKWNGSNTGDACALFDTDGDGNANRAICVSVGGTSVIQPGSPACFTCGDTAPDRCPGAASVACTSTCSVAIAANDPFALDPNHVGNACDDTAGCPGSATCCRNKDAQTSCCITAGDSGGGVLIDVCSFPSANPNSAASDCIVTTECSKQNPNDPVCNDQNPCTVDSCDSTLGVCRHVAGNSGTICRSAAGACDAQETCNGTSLTCPPDGFATGTPCRNATGLCDVAENCDGTGPACPADGVAASGVVCRPSSGNVCDVAEACNGVDKACPPDGSQPNTTPCNDNDACTTGDHCDGAGGCEPGTTITCNDNNGCTDDGCNPQSGCTYTPNNAPCNDNNACTTSDACAGGACVGGPAPNCNDNNPCTDDGCDPATGCENTNNGAPCDDNDACTTDDTCSGGSCHGGPPTNCDDNNACTHDSCDTQTGCDHQPVGGSCCNVDGDCVDTDACTTNNRCVANQCVSDPVDCNDHNDCTDDGCDPVEGCTNVDNSNPCDDGSACTEGDACAGGSCVGAFIDCRDGNVCTDDSCDPSTGCVNDPNTAPCNDNDACTTVDACVDKECVGSVPPNCDDQNPCTDDACVAPGGCVSTNNAVPCSDDDPCTENDTCAGGSCVPGPDKDCNDLNGCTDDTCNVTTGECEYVDNADPCSDGDLCTEGDICFQGECQPGSPKTCNDGLFCTDDSCAPNGECVHTPRDQPEPCCDTNEQCADTDECTVNERCVDHACLSDQRDCTDDSPCTIDSCQSEGGGFACQNVHCSEVQDSDCPEECTADCGNGIVSPELNETCDPPGSSTPFPGVVCRADCTFCGDGVTQTQVGEACDDGNKIEGCIKNDSFPVDPCRNDCTLHICRDPTKAVFAAAIDKFTFHGRLTSGSAVDFTDGHFLVELTTPSGQVLFRKSLAAGAILSVNPRVPGRYRYVNRAAKKAGGISKVKVRRNGDAYRTTVEGYGNLLGVQEHMVTHVRTGATRWLIKGDWEQRGPRLWRFIEP